MTQGMSPRLQRSLSECLYNSLDWMFSRVYLWFPFCFIFSQMIEFWLKSLDHYFKYILTQFEVQIVPFFVRCVLFVWQYKCQAPSSDFHLLPFFWRAFLCLVRFEPGRVRLFTTSWERFLPAKRPKRQARIFISLFFWQRAGRPPTPPYYYSNFF